MSSPNSTANATKDFARKTAGGGKLGTSDPFRPVVRSSGISVTTDRANTFALAAQAAPLALAELADPALLGMECVVISGRKAAKIPIGLLYVHKNNVRPVSARVGELRTAIADDMAERDLQDPIHVFKDDTGRYAIYDGQRRFLAAKDLKKADILCWVSAVPLSDIEVYVFGLRQHANREQVTPFDQAVSWSRMLAEGVATQEKIASLHGIGQPVVSRLVGFMRSPASLLRQVESYPHKFGARDLYLLQRISVCSESRALELATAISMAQSSEDGDGDSFESRPTTRDMEALLETLQKTQEQGGDLAKTRRSAVARGVVREVSGQNGQSLGDLKIWPTGRFEFRPSGDLALPDAVVGPLQAKIEKLIKDALADKAGNDSAESGE